MTPLERLSEMMEAFALHWSYGEWVIIHEFGTVHDCTLESAVEASMKLIPEELRADRR